MKDLDTTIEAYDIHFDRIRDCEDCPYNDIDDCINEITYDLYKHAKILKGENRKLKERNKCLSNRGIDFSIEGIGQITNGKFTVLCITALLSVLDEYSDDERDYFVDRIDKILSKYSFNDFVEMYSIFDKNDDTIKN